MCNRSGCCRMCEKIMLWIITADVAVSLVFFFLELLWCWLSPLNPLEFDS